MNVRIISTLVALAAALVVASGASAAALTLSTAGSPGPWLSSGQGMHDIYCEGAYWYHPPYNRFFQLHAQNIGRSSAYPNHFQDIYMQAQLQWSGDGTNWYLYERRDWQKVDRVRPGFHAVFRDETFDVSSYRGFYWRVRVEFRWYFAGTGSWIGTAVDSFTPDGIRLQYQASSFTSNATGEGVCRLD
jgi:hypothetical protein